MGPYRGGVELSMWVPLEVGLGLCGGLYGVGLRKGRVEMGG